MNCNPPTLFLKKIIWAILGTSHFHIHVKNGFSFTTEIDRDYTEYIDHLFTEKTPCFRSQFSQSSLHSSLVQNIIFGNLFHLSLLQEEIWLFFFNCYIVFTSGKSLRLTLKYQITQDLRNNHPPCLIGLCQTGAIESTLHREHTYSSQSPPKQDIVVV